MYVLYIYIYIYIYMCVCVCVCVCVYLCLYVCLYACMCVFEMWSWRRMEKIRWTDHVRNEDLLPRVKEQRNILHEIRKGKANGIGHILRRNCLLQRVTEGKIQGGIEVTGRQGRRRRKLLDDLKERRGYSDLKEEALDRTIWRARFGRGLDLS